MKKSSKNHRIIEPNSLQNRINIIAETTVINGNFNTESDLRLEGTLKGVTSVKGKFVLEKKALQEGDIHCRIAEISGQVEGNIYAERIFLKSTANIRGNLTVNQLIIEAGAKFTGDCNMSNNFDKSKRSKVLTEETATN